MDLGISDFVSSMAQLATDYVESGMTYAVDSLKTFMYTPGKFVGEQFRKWLPNYESPYQNKISTTIKSEAQKQVKNNTKSRVTPSKPRWK